MSSKLIVNSIENTTGTHTINLDSGDSSIVGDLTVGGNLDLSSGGVYLGGSGSANLLDDYEEGTWVPQINYGTLTTSQGSYTKVGRLVKVTGRITGFSDTSTGQRVQILNLPFNAASGGDYECTGSAFARYTSKSAQAVYIPAGGDNAFFYAMAGGDWSNQELDHSDLTSSNADIYWSASYVAN